MSSYNVGGQTTKHWPQYVAGAAAAGGAFAIGTALGWPSPVGQRVRDEFELTRNQWDWVGSIITIGAAISCLPIGLLMKKFGRKWTMIALVVPFLIGWLLLIFATGFWMLFIGRFFLGLAGGAFCISAPQYSAEIAEKEIRGIIGTFFQLLINGGILFVYIIGPGWLENGPFNQVLWTNVVCAGVAVLFGVIFFFMPESPVYLVIENRIDDAKKSYKWLRGEHYDPQGEIDELKEELEEAKRNQITFGEAFKMRSTKMAMLIGFGLATFQQVSGINVVIFYATDIFESAQIELRSDILTIILGCINLVFTLVGALLVDRLGRKILLLASIIGMTLCTAALGAYFFLAENEAPEADNLAWLPVTSLGIFLVFFAIGYGPVVWLMIGEVYSKHVNAVIGPITGSYNWMFAWIITYFFGGLVEAIGTGWTFWIFSIGSIVGILFTFFIIPETKGKSMAEIQTMLNGESSRKVNPT